MEEGRRGMMSVSFWVHGTPIPKGSMKAFRHPKTGAVILTHSKGADLAAWSNRISELARGRIVSWDPASAGVPVSVTLRFTLQKPKSMSKKVMYPAKRPDLDKLIRSVLDSLTGIFYHDDSQVVKLVAMKNYGSVPGVGIEIEEEITP